MVWRVRQETFAEQVKVWQENLTATWGSARSTFAKFLAFTEIILLNLVWGVLLRSFSIPEQRKQPEVSRPKLLLGGSSFFPENCQQEHPQFKRVLVSHHCCGPCSAARCRAHNAAANFEMSQGLVSHYTPHPPQKRACCTYLTTPLPEVSWGSISKRKEIALH